MTADLMQRVQVLFDEAMTKAPKERAAFLATACDDAAVRAKVESLLAHHEQAGDAFMRVPTPDPRFSLRGIADGPDPRIGTTIGGYRIENVIASGGMGTVYLARQKQPDRHVAMKVMHCGIPSRSALRRFEYESQILARLRHPGIAQVYEAGTHSLDQSGGREGAVGRSNDRLGDEPARLLNGGLGDEPARSVPYFVMEYIPEARTITEYAAQEKLSARDRLGLFIQVCEAVQHGHQKGIIHRDLKPGNILVDSSGQVKIIDFGVARSTDSDVAVTTMKTDVGQLIGTMQYMSPEQCAADPDDLDMRSDVYALGVVLYELLFAQPPYDVSGTTIVGAARMICDTPPTPPSTITGRAAGGRGTGACGTGVSPVKRDLEMIVLKALKKDRQERYQSAAELAADIRRYLRGEPTEARPPTVWTRALRWAARRPVAATTATCVSVALGIIIATYVSVWYLNIRPYKMELRDGGHEARLISYGERPLKTWTAEVPGIIKFAKLVERPVGLGGGKLALVGFDQARKTPYPNSLCAFDAEGDLDHPVWQKQLIADDLPPVVLEGGLSEEDFGVALCLVADIYPERPGDEIVAVYSCLYSSRAIRVYDLRGNVLYQVWHRGSLNACYWMSGPRLLVFSGDNTEGKWYERGVSGEGIRAFPIVVFAVRPTAGVIERAYLSSEPGDDPLSPAWYKCIDPRFALDSAQFSVGPPLLKDSARNARISLEFEIDGTPSIGLGWDLDEYGSLVAKTRTLGDLYMPNQERYPEGDSMRLPDPDDFRLRELSEFPPPTQPSTGMKATNP